MTAIIARVRLKIFDPAGASQVFADQDIQDVLDDGARQDVFNMELTPKPTFSSGRVQWLDYLAGEDPTIGDWEDDAVLKQYLITVVTPSVNEPIKGHWQFAANTFPGVYLTGKTYDIYRASADLLELWAARYMTRFDFASDGQSFKVSQVPAQLQKLAQMYRDKQRVTHLSLRRSDLGGRELQAQTAMGPLEIDYQAQG